MKIRFKIVEGPGTGREFEMPLPKCLIGRNADCHVRPRSEAISRHHCAVYVRGAKVFVRDLGSRNGTHVNGRPVPSECELTSGDELRLGPLVLQIQIDSRSQVLSAEVLQRAKMTAAGHPSGASSMLDDSSIAEWVDQADAQARANRLATQDTRRLELKGRDRSELQSGSDDRPAENHHDGSSRQNEAVLPAAADRRPAKPGDPKSAPGRLPAPEEAPSKDSSDAAAKMLKRFFGRR